MPASTTLTIDQGPTHRAIAAHGRKNQQAACLPRLISGEWTATMNARSRVPQATLA